MTTPHTLRPGDSLRVLALDVRCVKHPSNSMIRWQVYDGRIAIGKGRRDDTYGEELISGFGGGDTNRAAEELGWPRGYFPPAAPADGNVQHKNDHVVRRRPLH